MRKPTLLFIAVTGCFLAAAAYAFVAPNSPRTQASESSPLSGAEAKLLSRGNILVKEIPQGPARENGGKTYEARAFIQSDLKRVYDNLTRFECCDRYMPHIKKSEVLWRKKGEAVVNYTFQAPFTKPKKYRLHMTYSKKKDEAVIRWKMIPWPGLQPKETIRDTQGYWILKNAGPVSGKKSDNRVLVIYRVYADPGNIPAGLEWIINAFTKKSIPALIQAVRRRTSDRPGNLEAGNVRRHSSYKPLLITPVEEKNTSTSPQKLI